VFCPKRLTASRSALVRNDNPRKTMFGPRRCSFFFDSARLIFDPGVSAYFDMAHQDVLLR